MKKTIFTVVSLSLTLTLSTFLLGCNFDNEKQTIIDDGTNFELPLEDDENAENLTDNTQDTIENLTNEAQTDDNEHSSITQDDQQKTETQESQDKTEEQGEQNPQNPKEKQDDLQDGQDGKEDNKDGQDKGQDDQEQGERDERDERKEPSEDKEEDNATHVHRYDSNNTCEGCLEKLDYTQNLAYGYDEYYCVVKNEQELYTDQDIIIPYYNDQNLITKVGVSAFEHTMIKSVKLYDNITQIGCYAFYCCVNLQTVYIPKSVTIIELYAFSNCDKDNLNVQFEDTKGWAVYDTIGDKVEDVPQSVFEDRENLANFLIELGSYNLVKS